MRRRLAAVAVSLLALSLTTAGCSRNTGTSAEDQERERAQQTSVIGTAEESKGPAKPMPGAKPGGTVTILEQSDFEHLDPARNYVSTQLMTGALMYRTLTNWQEDGSGQIKLVGDLATDAGKDVNGDCKVWEFTLKDGVKYEDGSEVTAEDVAYGVARSFAPELNEGPHYIQEWLTGESPYNKTYKGPYNGGAAIPPGVKVDGNKITFTFTKEPHCDMPFAAAMPTTAPVPKGKDTEGDYDNRPFSSGPYKVKEYVREQKLVLDRNPHWDAKTDPVRQAYPDSYAFTFGLEPATIAERLHANAPADQAAMTLTVNVPSEVLPKVLRDENSKKRTVEGQTQYVWYLAFNLQRPVWQDKKLRDAINIGLDKEGLLKVNGGQYFGTPATTLMSPTTIGWKKYDAYGVPPTGDKEKAKQLLGGQAITLKYAYRNIPNQAKIAAFIKEDLAKLGITVQLLPIDRAQYYDQIGRKDNQYDMYLGGWGSDWPDGNTIIPPVFDGRTIGPEGNYNFSYFNEKSVSDEIDRIRKLPLEKSTQEWIKLDEKIMKEYAPCVPVYYDVAFTQVGSKLGGFYLSDSYGATSLWPIYVKS